MAKRKTKAVVAAVVLAISPLAWAGFQFVGPAPLSQGPQRGASSVYLRTAQPAAIATQTSPAPPGMNGYVRAFKKVAVLTENGAGIAPPCRGGGSAPLNEALYKLMPEGWSLYAKPGTILNLPVWYSCHDNPWTSVVAQVLKRSGYEGTLWWGYDMLTIAPRPMRPMPAIAGVKPSTKAATQPTANTLTKPDPVSLAVDPAQTTIPLKQAVKALPSPVSMTTVHVGGTTPLTIGPNGEVIQPGLKQKVIPLVQALNGHWRLELPTHPDHREIALAKAWLNAGGTLFSPLPRQ
ncbi:hypothetical protein JKG47_07070 [Acidithiobacillus sp. MC6.1]|nr:hypothetical protein [Acidithiobacillus sp. MC6.1]